MSFFALVAESVAALQESALDREYIASEEFSDFLENLTIRVANARAREKRERFRAVLLAAMQGHREPRISVVKGLPVTLLTNKSMALRAPILLTSTSDRMPRGM